ncbi:hypothetical protein ACFO5Q_17565 [Kordiimonas lipolytica]|uniref:Tetratricopeptide repeat-containing protein n=1 Tax=Kordiimonas lipolytica TaxID=1662421 RepID=A0ABV8UGT1_9PROT|nr:tetratricopeptide repeat protein [Kordiimonas lipolytica]
MPANTKSEEDALLEGLPVIDTSDIGLELDDEDLQQLGMDFNIQKSPQTVSKPEAIKAFKAAEKAAKKMDWGNVAKHLLIAWDAVPNDLGLLTLLAHSLVQLGVREKAIAVLERALKYHEPTPDICAIMLELAVKMEFYDIAIKVGHQLIAMDADTPSHFVNLASAYSGAERYDEGIELLQAVLPRFPKHGDLWNVLATMVRFRDGIGPSYVFLDEALRVDPTNYKALSNYAQSLTFDLRLEEALKMDARAMRANPSNPEPFLGAAQLQFYFGKLDKAWDNYTRRLDHTRRLNQTQIFTHKVPKWKGQDLAGKSLFILGEQGIGDEVMFGTYMTFLYEQVEKLYIGCDYRLVSIYQRRFPNATVEAYRDAFAHNYRYRSFPKIESDMAKGEISIDYAIEVASCPRFEWTKTANIKPHPAGYLVPDPELDEKFKDKLAAAGSKPKIGIAWRSGNLTGLRSGIYASIEELGPLFALKDEVDFVNLQYGECADELVRAKELFGVDIIQFDDVDLKKDIEANLAIMNNCDFVVAAVSAPAIFSQAIGTRTVLLTQIAPWWCFGDREKIPFAPGTTFIDAQGGVSWAEVAEFAADTIRRNLG